MFQKHSYLRTLCSLALHICKLYLGNNGQNHHFVFRQWFNNHTRIKDWHHQLCYIFFVLWSLFYDNKMIYSWTTNYSRMNHHRTKYLFHLELDSIIVNNASNVNLIQSQENFFHLRKMLPKKALQWRVVTFWVITCMSPWATWSTSSFSTTTWTWQMCSVNWGDIVPFTACSEKKESVKREGAGLDTLVELTICQRNRNI